MRIVSVILLCSMLGACATAAQRLAMDENRCGSYGFVKGTQQFSNCMMQRDLARAHNAAIAAGSGPTTTHCSTYFGQTNCTSY